MAVRAALMKVEGVKEAKADYRKNWAWARYDATKVTPEKLVDSINTTTAFKASLPRKKSQE